LPDYNLISSIQADIREIRKDSNDAAVQLGSIDTKLESIFDYIKTCEAKSDAHEKRITTTENTIEVQGRNLRFIVWFFSGVIGFIAWLIHG
jgi:peptidoglycan hydrolase CwlO-like protein